MTPDHFDAIRHELHAASDANREALAFLVEAGHSITRSHEAMTRAFELSAHAEGHRDDLRETVARLETLVLDLAKEVRELRDRKNGGA